MTEPARNPESRDRPAFGRLAARSGPLTNRPILPTIWPGCDARAPRQAGSRRPCDPTCGSARPDWRRGLGAVWARHRLAVGGVAASIALAGALLLALNSGVQLSAMERMAKELQEITSYSYRSSGSNTDINNDGKRETRKDDCTVVWLAPDAFHEETKIVKIVEDVGGGNRTEKSLAISTSLSARRKGVLIDHRHKTFDRIRYEPIGSKTYPWDMLRMIREGSYDVLADLGTKRIGDTEAHGYRLALKNPHDKENTVDDPVELWVDPETNLPIEIGWAGESEGWKYTDRTSDFRWNIALDSKLFEPVIPQGYADITPPTEQSDLDQIVAALRLFAQLSGGHYPPTKSSIPPRSATKC